MTDENKISHIGPGRTGRVVQVSVNPKGGVPKYRVPEARLLPHNVEGDKQRNLKFHGGPERAVCLFSWEVIRELQEEGHSIDCGTTGENLTLGGIDWSLLAPGVQLQIGDEALIEITRPTTPCKTIEASFTDGYFNRIHHQKFPRETRYYARIINEGVVHEGDSVTVSLLPDSH